MRKFFSSALHLFSSHKQLPAQIEHLLGFKPGYLPYYQIAFTHRSNNDEIRENNERLEYLGDAFLGAIVGEYLFKLYPNADEGFLTELRSKMVRRETLNNVASRMGLQKLVVYNEQDRNLTHSHIFGNALEALIGAVYLDKGFVRTRKFIIEQLIRPYINVLEMAASDYNYKNQLLTWAQKQNIKVTFEVLHEVRERSRRVFTVGIRIQDEIVAEGKAYTKKEAGQVAARHALAKLDPLQESSG